MLPSLLLALLFALQDPKPPPKTVEDRLKELGDRLAALEKKEKSLSDENAALEKRVAEEKAFRETIARQPGLLWVQRYAAPVEFTEAQSREFQELWYGWMKEENEKSSDSARWKTREEALRSKLTREQIPLLARQVREEQLTNARRLMAFALRSAKLSAEKSTALEEACLRRLSFGDGVLLVQAHPQETASWGQIVSALESSLADPSSTLTDDERAALQKALGPWKPKPK